MKVLWSPTKSDFFLTYSNSSVYLYQTSQGAVELNDGTYATRLAENSEVPFIKCVAWSPAKLEDNLVAVGTANGRVILSNFGQKADNDLDGREFVPKHQKQCVYLFWNPLDHNLLAEGLDKHSKDCCVAIWDINAKTGGDTASLERQRYSSSTSDINAVTRPYVEIGHGETTTSFSWFHKEPKAFVTGMSGRLKVYDIRDASKPHLFAQTKAVYGVCADPLSDSRIASFSESHIALWDTRSFEKPLLTLQETKPVITIDWCPTRRGYLAVLCKDSSTIKLFDIRHSVIGSEELDPVITERTVQPKKLSSISYFSWHPTFENRLLTVSPDGELRDVQVYERMPLTFASNFHFSWACGKKVIDLYFEDEEIDISIKMKNRALGGYGLCTEDPMQNALAVKNEPHLYGLWSWLTIAKDIIAQEEFQSKTKGTPSTWEKFIGVKNLLWPDNTCIGGQRSEMETVTWSYPDGSRGNTSQENSPIYKYTSPLRSRALQLCGWDYKREARDSLLGLLASLQTEGDFERAAAIALFNLKIGKAVDILCQANLPNGNAVAMALAGFTNEKNALWRKTCANLRHSLEDPYLRAMFTFLSSDKENFDEVLTEEPCMAVKDRVAFACIYLDDQKLWEYLKNLSQELKEKGNLDGILLTGASQEGVELLQSYVDITSDIQTAALAAIYCMPSEITKDTRISTWIESYRILLDSWRLWHQRSKFDIMRHILDSNIRVPTQAFISCNFCGKSVACNMTLASKVRPYMMSGGQSTQTKQRLTCCPGCKKSLPRCSICLMNLGTPSGSALYLQKEPSDFEEKLSSYGNWFTWCQTCRHGGHAAHIRNWFQNHSDCPVSGCSCKCMTLDSVGQLSAQSE
ncbi:hypothetical protein CHS0354_031537 [Potamilus streckersoni]|uniref:WD repeat protein mio zinc-ribbon like domain-containing protein n=1 Tax=Potamilus streckersoni TaxID=2493646 RepID=A0AAE0SHE4_9BIVA|nr:hypothetical protein CHS0354_031537 [Potamilus streckersoni]